jgi:hypothetical protein
MKTNPKTPTLLEWSWRIPQSQLFFNKSNSIRSRTEKYKDYSHTSFFFNYEFLLIKKSLIFRLYRGLNTYENITLMDWFDPLKNWSKNPKPKSP